MDVVHHSFYFLLNQPDPEALSVLEQVVQAFNKRIHDTSYFTDLLCSLHNTGNKAGENPYSAKVISAQEFLEEYMRALSAFNKSSVRQSCSNSCSELSQSSASTQQDSHVRLGLSRDLILATLLYLWLVLQKHDDSAFYNILQRYGSTSTSYSQSGFSQTVSRCTSSTICSRTAENSVQLPYDSLTLLDLMYSIMDEILKRVSYILSGVNSQDTLVSAVELISYYTPLRCWGTSMCRAMCWILIQTSSFDETVNTSSFPQTDSRKLIFKLLRRSLNLSCDILSLLVHSEKDLLGNSSFLQEFACLVFCQFTPQGVLRSSCSLKDTLGSLIFSYRGDCRTHHIFMLLGCYIASIQLSHAKSHQMAFYMKSISEEKSLWRHYLEKALDHLKQELEMVSQLSCESPVQQHHRIFLLSMERLLIFISYLIRFPSGHPLSAFPQFKEYHLTRICPFFPLKSILNVLLQCMKHVLQVAQNCFEWRLHIASNMSESYARSVQYAEDVYTMMRKEKFLALLEPLLEKALNAFSSLFNNVPPHMLMLYSCPLKAFFNIFLGEIASPSASNSSDNHISPSLVAWGIQFRYSGKWCTLLNLFLSRIPCLVESSHTLSLLLSSLQRNMQFVISPLDYAYTMVEAYVRKRSTHLHFTKLQCSDTSLSKSFRAALLENILDFLSSDLKSHFMRSHQDASGSVPQTRLMCFLPVAIDMFYMAKALYEKFNVTRMPLVLRVQLDEIALRLLWKQTTSSGPSGPSNNGETNIWSSPVLNDQRIDLRVLLTQEIIAFLKSSLTGTEGLLSPLFPVAIGILTRLTMTIASFKCNPDEIQSCSPTPSCVLKQDLENFLTQLKQQLMSKSPDIQLNSLGIERIQQYSCLFSAFQTAALTSSSQKALHSQTANDSEFSHETFHISGEPRIAPSASLKVEDLIEDNIFSKPAFEESLNNQENYGAMSDQHHCPVQNVELMQDVLMKSVNDSEALNECKTYVITSSAISSPASQETTVYQKHTISGQDNYQTPLDLSCGPQYLDEKNCMKFKTIEMKICSEVEEPSTKFFMTPSQRFTDDNFSNLPDPEHSDLVQLISDNDMNEKTQGIESINSSSLHHHMSDRCEENDMTILPSEDQENVLTEHNVVVPLHEIKDLGSSTTNLASPDSYGPLQTVITAAEIKRNQNEGKTLSLHLFGTEEEEDDENDQFLTALGL